MSAELFLLLSTVGRFPGGLPVEVRDGLTEWDVSPGVIGFLVTLALVLACIPLFRSMTGKIRGVQHRDPAGASADDAGPGADDAGPGAGVGTGSGSDT